VYRERTGRAPGARGKVTPLNRKAASEVDVEKKIRLDGILRESMRMALLGALGGYVFLVLSSLSGWVDPATFRGWNLLVNNFWGVTRAISAALFFYPAVGFLVNLFAGAMTYLFTTVLGLSEERRRRVGVVVVGVVCFAVLSLRVLSTWIFTWPVFSVDDVFKLILGAGFIWAALKWDKITALIARFAGWALAGAAVLWTAFCFIFPGMFTTGKPGPPKPDAPNVVLFLSDALRADVTSLYGGQVPMPNLERLAARGVTFTDCYSPSSWTEPCVVALFTGLAPEVSGMDSFSAIPSAIPYLSEQLSRGGYRTWCMMANIILTPALGFSRGFDFLRPLQRLFLRSGLSAVHEGLALQLHGAGR
jgi:hypothetical protein